MTVIEVKVREKNNSAPDIITIEGRRFAPAIRETIRRLMEKYGIEFIPDELIDEENPPVG